MIILHSYLAGTENTEQERETWQALKIIRRKYQVLDVTTNSPDPEKDKFALEDAFAENWGKEAFIHIERDVVPTMGMIDSLAECPHPICMQTMFAPGLTKRPFSGFTGSMFSYGFCKISLTAQTARPAGLWHRTGNGWSDFEPRFWAAFRSLGGPFAQMSRGSHKHNLQWARHLTEDSTGLFMLQPIEPKHGFFSFRDKVLKRKHEYEIPGRRPRRNRNVGSTS